MTDRYSLKLNAVEAKVIDELDILTDAMVTTFNKIGNVVQTFSKDISVEVEKFRENKLNWKPNDKMSFNLSFMPFLDGYDYNKEFYIELLNQYFSVAGQKNLLKEKFIKGKKTRLNDLCFAWGFTYDIAQKKCPSFFSFEIREDKSNQRIFSEEDYVIVSTRIKKLCKIQEQEDDFYDLKHPSGKDFEYFTIWLDYKKYSDKLPIFFQTCRDELVKPFLSKIKD